jgi:hypothetical protein
MSNTEPDDALEGIAIIGLAGRFPGARDVAEFWRNLHDGIESITHFTDEELEASGINRSVFSASNYVRAGFVVDDIEMFDASFFGFNPREGAVLDPQQRLFMECAWEALEHAGYDPDRYQGRIGLYAGASQSSYYFNLLSNREVLEADPGFQFMILHGNDKDYLTTRTSYKRHGADRLLDLACRGCARLPEFADLPVRYGFGRRRKPAGAAEGRPPLSGGEYLLARRPQPRLRRRGTRYGAEQRARNRHA